MNDLNPRAGIGGNMPPEPIGLIMAGPELTASLVALTSALAERVAQLKVFAEGVTVKDDQTAEDGTLAIAQIKTAAEDIDKIRQEAKAPYLAAERAIDHFCAQLVRPMVGDDIKSITGGFGKTLADQVDAWRRQKLRDLAAENTRKKEEALALQRKQEALQAQQRQAERRRQEQQAELRRKKREAEQQVKKAESPEQRQRAQAVADEAEKTRRAADDAARARESQLALEKEHAGEDAARLLHQSRTTARVKIDTGLGAKATGRKLWVAEIKDLDEAAEFVRRLKPSEFRAAVQKIVDELVRSRIRVIPGVNVTEVAATTFHRR